MRSTSSEARKSAPIRVARYLRVSTSEQAQDGFWLETQARLLQSYVDANSDQGWVTSDDLIYIDDGISGATQVSERPALSKLKVDLLEGKFEVLLVMKIDRLFRKTSYLLEFIEFIRKHNVNFVSKNEAIDLSSHTGKLVLTLLWAISEMEREVIAERTSEGKISKALQGYIVFWSGVPYGYILENDGRGNKLKIHSGEAEIVKEIFKMYVTDGFSSNEIAKALTSRKVGSSVDRMMEEGEWVRKKRNPGFFHQTLVTKVLRNEIYLGRYVCNRRETRKEDGKTTIRMKDSSEWITIECEPIVDEVIFAKAQELHAKACVMRGRGEAHLFTGFLKCGECGRSLNYYLSRKKTGNYRCSGKKRDKVAPENYCKNPDISEKKLIELVWPQIEYFLKHPEEAVKAYEARMQKSGEREKEAKLQKELANAEDIIANKKKARRNVLKASFEWSDLTEDYESLINEFWRDIQIQEKLKEAIIKDLFAIKERKELLESVKVISAEFQKKLGKITEKERDDYIKRLTHLVEVFKDGSKVVYKFEK